MTYVRTWLAIAVLLRVAALPAGEISTVAGTGKSSLGAFRGAARDVNVGAPFGVDFGPQGKLYICEVANHRVLRLDLSTGQVETIVGNGEKGHDGDGGKATEARLNEPYEVRFDRAGNLYVVEMKSAVVRRVDAKRGLITTIAGPRSATRTASLSTIEAAST